MSYRCVCLLLVFSVLMTAVPVNAQDAPPAGPPASRPGGPATGSGQPGTQSAPTNLKALPKTMSGDDVMKLMLQYQGDLGVQCEFCHAQNPTTHRTDYASDSNPIKDTARFMMTMTDDLNNQYLENLPGRRYGDPITCGTCHRGESHPSIFEPKPRTQQAGGLPAAGSAPGAAPAAKQ